MARLNIERQCKLQPKRFQFAKVQIEKLGYEVTSVNLTELRFKFKSGDIKFFPYSGWATGTTIKDGRGLYQLLKQIKN